MPHEESPLLETLLELGRAAARSSTELAEAARDEAFRALRGQLYITSHLLEGEVFPAWTFLGDLAAELQSGWLEVLWRKRLLADHLGQLATPLASAMAYEGLVHTLGQELFGSARYAGETRLWEDDVYRLSYLPPTGESAGGAALFQVAGFIPYGDRVFRLLPERNLYAHFLERGLPVYLLELRGDRRALGDLGAVTLARVIDTLDQAAGIALAHHGRKLIAGAYCGTGIHLLAYLAARPRDAEAKLETAALFMAPVDGRQCTRLAEILEAAPRSLAWLQLRRAELTGGAVPGLELWGALDLGLKNLFVKTPLGRFASGWRRPGYAAVRTLADLSPEQRFELADDYWTSVHNATRYPLPVALVRQAASHFERGVDGGGELHYDYRGAPLNLCAVREQTTLRLDGFYGALDKVVSEQTGRVLQQILGERYGHHVDPGAKHISYIDAPERWQRGHAAAFTPNPIDVILARYAAKTGGR